MNISTIHGFKHLNFLNYLVIYIVLFAINLRITWTAIDAMIYHSFMNFDLRKVVSFR